MARLFLFPHQDDEFGVFATLRRLIRAHVSVTCAFLTTSPRGDSLTAIRNGESRRVLGRLGLNPDCIETPGLSLRVVDGGVLARCHEVAAWLADWLTKRPDVEEIFVPAWEGGHPDHDAVHAIAVLVCGYLHPNVSVRQFPLYNGCALPAGLFRVSSPLAENGGAESFTVSFRARLQFLLLCFCYRSQWRSWLGLWPALALRYAVTGKEFVQKTSVARLAERPHSGILYYERRGFSTWGEVATGVRELKSRLERLSAAMPER